MLKNLFLRNLLKLGAHVCLTDAYACAKFLRVTRANFEIFNIKVGPMNVGSIGTTTGKTAFKFIVGKCFLRL